MNRAAALAKLDLVRDNLQKLELLPQGSFEEFMSNFLYLDSALHRLQTAIQALIDLGSVVIADRGLRTLATSRDVLAVLDQAELLPPGSELRFGATVGFQDRVVHAYDAVDPRIVYRVLTEQRSELRVLAEQLASLIPDSPG